MRWFTLVAGSLAFLAPTPLAEDLTVETAPPVVVKAVPQAGESDVDPRLTELRVTFSKDMFPASWSWVLAGQATAPKTTGMPRYEDDKRTCVLPVKLESGKTYAIWINTERQGNFKDAAGRKALPYLLVFRTKN